MDWYALFVKNGNEEKFCTLMQRVIAHQRLEGLSELFVPKRKLIEYRQGISREVLKPLFPGYVLVKTDDICRLYHSSPRGGGFLHLLTNENLQPSVIRKEEICQIRYLADEQGIIGISSAYVEKERVSIVSGPLKNYDGNIKKIDKRRNRARILFRFNNMDYALDLGIHVIDHLRGDEQPRIFAFSQKS